MEPKADAPAVELRDVHKSFGEQVVLKGVTLNLRQGETVAVLGRSGTGKSVLLRLLIGLQKPDSGSIQIHGQDIVPLPIEELNALRTKVGFLFQEAALYDSVSVEDNVAFPLRHRRPAGTTRGSDVPASRDAATVDVDKRVTELLAFVGMEEARHKMPSEISGGMKKRVGLARALALQPDILLFDEPTSALDPITAREIGDLLLKLKTEQHVASIIVTHDLHSARHVADRLALIHEGTIVADGTFEELQRSTHPFVAQFLREAA